MRIKGEPKRRRRGKIRRSGNRRRYSINIWSLTFDMRLTVRPQNQFLSILLFSESPWRDPGILTVAYDGPWYSLNIWFLFLLLFCLPLNLPWKFWRFHKMIQDICQIFGLPNFCFSMDGSAAKSIFIFSSSPWNDPGIVKREEQRGTDLCGPVGLRSTSR